MSSTDGSHGVGEQKPVEHGKPDHDAVLAARVVPMDGWTPLPISISQDGPASGYNLVVAFGDSTCPIPDGATGGVTVTSAVVPGGEQTLPVDGTDPLPFGPCSGSPGDPVSGNVKAVYYLDGQVYDVDCFNPGFDFAFNIS